MSERAVLYSREEGFKVDGDPTNIIGELSSSLLTPDEARILVDFLNRQFAGSMGKAIEIDCGRLYTVGDGVISGTEERSGRDMSERYNSGIKREGILLRFDVLDYGDSLVSRGTGVTVSEPCVVFQEHPPKIHQIPEPKVTEIFVPFIRLGQMIERVQ